MDARNISTLSLAESLLVSGAVDTITFRRPDGDLQMTWTPREAPQSARDELMSEYAKCTEDGGLRRYYGQRAELHRLKLEVFRMSIWSDLLEASIAEAERRLADEGE